MNNQADILTNIMETATYNELSFIQRKIIRARHNVEAIEHGLILAKNIGYEKWIATSQASNRNKLIVKDLIDNV